MGLTQRQGRRSLARYLSLAQGEFGKEDGFVLRIVEAKLDDVVLRCRNKDGIKIRDLVVAQTQIQSPANRVTVACFQSVGIFILSQHVLKIEVKTSTIFARLRLRKLYSTPSYKRLYY